MALASIDVDRLLNETLRTMNGGGWAPPCNAYEDDHGFHIDVAVPGRDRQDMEVVFEDSVLTVKGQVRTESQDKRRYFAHEIDTGPFTRSFRLPAYVDPDKVAASYQNGILSLTLPKREEAKPRRIEIL